MKRLLLALALILAPSWAVAQCNGTFPNNTVCGNITGSSNLPRPTSTSVIQGTGIPPGNLTSPNCTRMWPTSNFIGNWNVADAYGNAVSTSGSTSQGLQEAITFSINNGQCLQVYGQGTLALGSQSATLNSTTTVTGLNTATLLAGDYVVATAGGIPAFTKITSVDSGTQIHISNAATVTATRTLGFTRPAGSSRPSQITANATIQIPPVEQWSFQAYDVNLTCGTGVNVACVQFDSAIIMGFDWIGGQIVYQPSTPTVNSIAVLFAPTNPVPIDGIVAVSDSHVFISNIASPATNGNAEAVVGFNISGGTVSTNRFTFNELNGTGQGSVGTTNFNVKIFAPGASTAFEQNIIDIAHAHLAASAGLQIGVVTTNAANLRHNIWRVGGIKPSGASSSGINSFGSYDLLEVGGITSEEGTLNQGINLQSSAVGNKVIYGQILGAGTALIDGGTCNSWSGASGTKEAFFGTTSGCTTLQSAAVASGLLTMPAATDTLVGRNTTDTLTNKTIGVSNLNNGTGASATTFWRGDATWATPAGNVAPSPITNSLGADVAMNNTANYFDGPSVAQGTSGTWFASGNVTVTDTSAANIACKLWDGTTMIDSSFPALSATFNVDVHLSGVLANPAANIKISCKDVSNTTGKIVFNASGNSKDSTITAYRIQ